MTYFFYSLFTAGTRGRQEADYHLTLAVVTLLGWFVLVCRVGNLKLFQAWFLMSKSNADVMSI
jgi:hypothetical protein